VVPGGGRSGLVVVEQPFSPSLFLDLPPTPHHDDDPNNVNDDLLLPFISRILMEDDIDDKFFYQFPDHPALLHAQQSFAQILHAPSSSSDDTTNNMSNSSDDGETQSAPDDMEMLNMAFLKGREEANKFLPTNNTLFSGFKAELHVQTKRRRQGPEEQARRGGRPGDGDQQEQQADGART
jgi:hypothetical protein